MKKLFALLSIVAALVLAGCSALPNDETSSMKTFTSPKKEAAVTSATPVQLSFAKQRIVNLGSAYVAGVIEGEIEIANLAYTKNVEIHYSVAGGAWKTQNAVFNRTINQSSEIWTMSLDLFNCPNTGLWNSVACEFALKYTVNGVTYWDNNGGNNYKISTTGTNIVNPTVILKTVNVLLVSANAYKNGWPAYANTLNYSVAVKNLGYSKKVSIVYSTDNWKTTYTSPLTYEKTLAGTDTEIWSAYPLIALDVTGLSFAVAYEVNGVTYWDNNKGANYSLSMPGSL